MTNLVIESIGYIAILTGFFAITKKDMGKFRLWHLVSSFFYIIYGAMLNSVPLVIAGIVFCIIHVYHLIKMYDSNKGPKLKT